MARMKGPRFKQCRRLGLNVSGHPKAMKRAGNGQSREVKNLSPYGQQLLEKQRLRGYYEVMEKQFSRYVADAIKDDDLTSHSLLKKLEMRLDNVVYRLGFARSIRQARQMVVHGHVQVNNKKVNIPSYILSVGDTIILKEKSRDISLFKENLETIMPMSYPYLSRNPETFSGSIVRLPEIEEVPIDIDMHLVVEYYSKIS